MESSSASPPFEISFENKSRTYGRPLPGNPSDKLTKCERERRHRTDPRSSSSPNLDIFSLKCKKYCKNWVITTGEIKKKLKTFSVTNIRIFFSRPRFIVLLYSCWMLNQINALSFVILIAGPKSHTIKQEVLQFNGKEYKKLVGRAYRSYWTCLNRPCEGQVLINELKGGSIKLVKEHSPGCISNHIE